LFKQRYHFGQATRLTRMIDHVTRTRELKSFSGPRRTKASVTAAAQ